MARCWEWCGHKIFWQPRLRSLSCVTSYRFSQSRAALTPFQYSLSSCGSWHVLNIGPSYGPDWLAEIIVKHGPGLTKKFRSSFLIRMIKVRLLNCRTFITTGLIQLFSNPALCSDTHPNTKYSYWISDLDAMQYSIPFPNFWRNELSHGATFLTDSAQMSLVWCRVD